MRKYTIPQNMEVEYFLGDHLGSTSITTDSSGNKVSEMRYTAWGEVRYESGTTPTEYTYTGQFSYTADFGLMYYNARWYDPALGRFAQADTLIPGAGNPQAWDRYAYANNNPVKYVDPSGHTGKIPPIITIISNVYIHFSNEWDLIASGACFIACIFLPFHYEKEGLGEGAIVGDTPEQQLNKSISGLALPLTIKPGKSSDFDDIINGLKDNRLSSLPVRNGKNDPTTGILEANGQEITLTSGKEGPAFQELGGKGSGFDAYTRTHVEGHASAWMRQNNVTESTLYINNPPCPNCNRNLPRMLPRNSVLDIFGPDGYFKRFFGLEE